jgi:hypothetical protein
MARRTVSLPDAVDRLVREVAAEGESFSSTVARLIEVGARSMDRGGKPRYVSSGEGDPDLGRRAESYLRKLARSR